MILIKCETRLPLSPPHIPSLASQQLGIKSSSSPRFPACHSSFWTIPSKAAPSAPPSLFSALPGCKGLFYWPLDFLSVSLREWKLLESADFVACFIPASSVPCTVPDGCSVKYLFSAVILGGVVLIRLSWSKTSSG